MPAPPLNGIAVSSSAVALESRTMPGPIVDLGGAFMGFDARGVGLVLALLLLAYWYRRVL